MSIKIVVLVILFLLLLNTCTENPINGDDNIPPGRRDYDWTVFVNPFQGAFFRSLWGSSPNDIWVCGDAIDSRMTLWHFDGNNWIPSNKYIIWPTYLLGFSSSDIWLSTANSEIWHYDGSDWTLFQKLEYPGFADVVIERMGGKAPNDIYASGFADSQEGYEGIILHFNGQEWSFLNIDKDQVSFFIVKYDANSSTYLLAASNWDGVGTPNRLYSLKGNSLVQLYAGEVSTTIDNIKGVVYIQQVNTHLQFESRIYKYRNGGLELWKDFTNTQYISRIWGRSEADFFCNTTRRKGFERGIGHYNGTDLITIYPIIDDWSTSDAIVFDSEVVILFQNQFDNTNHLLIGRLKK